jgi:hypothetical protein
VAIVGAALLMRRRGGKPANAPPAQPGYPQYAPPQPGQPQPAPEYYEGQP